MGGRPCPPEELAVGIIWSYFEKTIQTLLRLRRPENLTVRRATHSYLAGSLNLQLGFRSKCSKWAAALPPALWGFTGIPHSKHSNPRNFLSLTGAVSLIEMAFATEINFPLKIHVVALAMMNYLS
jgi:hypothetical protein